MIDLVACEPQFLDHLAPVWHALPLRGRFLVDAGLVDRAAGLGIDATPIDAEAVRGTSPPPLARPGEGPTALVASIGDTKVARRLGYRRFAFIEHGAGQSYAGAPGVNARNPSYPGGIDREDTGLFMVPNEYAAALWRRAYPQARVEVVGSPKLETLPRRRLDPIAPGTTVAVSFHWPAFVAPEAGTALGTYAPVLTDLAKRFHVIGHAHPKGDWPERMARIYRRAGIEFVRDFDEVCRRADLYVCDNSSTLFEFAATGRPVVVLNAPEFRRTVHHGGRFWDWATVGLQVDRAADLADTIEAALTDPEPVRTERERVLDLVYAHRTGAAERAAQAVVSWLAPVEVAA